MVENSCLNCAKAKWQRNKDGRLHASGDGVCTWQMKPHPIPNAFYYLGGDVLDHKMPKPSGGWISRKEPFKDCPLFHPALHEASAKDPGS